MLLLVRCPGVSPEFAPGHTTEAAAAAGACAGLPPRMVLASLESLLALNVDLKKPDFLSGLGDRDGLVVNGGGILAAAAIAFFLSASRCASSSICGVTRSRMLVELAVVTGFGRIANGTVGSCGRGSVSYSYVGTLPLAIVESCDAVEPPDTIRCTMLDLLLFAFLLFCIASSRSTLSLHCSSRSRRESCRAFSVSVFGR